MARCSALALVALAAVSLRNGNVEEAGQLFVNSMALPDSEEAVRFLLQSSAPDLSVTSSDFGDLGHDVELESLASLSRQISISMEAERTCADTSEGADSET
jgi:hypothetical protein